MELPKDEEPTIATVLDKEKLKDQLFFAKAENGDKVIIYSKNQKAILYRPSINKIIDVAPISIAPPQVTPTVTPTAIISDTPTPTVAKKKVVVEPTTSETPSAEPTPTDKP